ncbi:hypothetical protein CMI41_00420 [Candidatus Pacearchaeota archaeon]|jgi:hypothetical protein|nr:hypothetical protein [Candidatus Pacearchaeota archaeon]|tara:strand:+ start:8981 stop:9451 length:471 start_codon:yes stop_codon:yes gene_type:complete
MEDEKTAQEKYESLSFELPTFKQVAEDFDIEKVFEKDSSFALRDIRHAIVEKITAYSQLFETFQNPGSSPMFILTLLRNTKEQDKEIISEIYKKLAKIQIDSIKLDTIYKEKNEAIFIKETVEEWQETKTKILELIERLEKETDKKSSTKTSGYFG